MSSLRKFIMMSLQMESVEITPVPDAILDNAVLNNAKLG